MFICVCVYVSGSVSVSVDVRMIPSECLCMSGPEGCVSLFVYVVLLVLVRVLAPCLCFWLSLCLLDRL